MYNNPLYNRFDETHFFIKHYIDTATINVYLLYYVIIIINYCYYSPPKYYGVMIIYSSAGRLWRAKRTENNLPV